MTLDEAFEALAAPGTDIPFGAMQMLLGGWDEAGPRCQAMLRDYVAGRDMSERTERALFYAVHLLGDRCETAAFDDLCALAGDPDRADLILGDALTETMPRILVSCFAGDPAPLQRLIERREADPVIRGAALLGMSYLAAAKRLTRTALHAYLAGLYDRLSPDDDEFVWYAWVTAVGLLGFGALAGKADTVFEQGGIPPSLGNRREFRADLLAATNDPAWLGGFEQWGVGPLGSALEALESLGQSGPEGSAPVQAPYVNALRDVGRNDPCPCGSGKKYKKCCLGVAVGP